MGHGAWGMGHGAWGMGTRRAVGHGAWGIGHWELGNLKISLLESLFFTNPSRQRVK
ncbi:MULTISPECIES: hypothetical protein [unclassified Microcoleus]|uniref:hypothetical protein n=1 Tax=unclassified Microcoleus TaxID=2642155 RepID=UPI002FD07199